MPVLPAPKQAGVGRRPAGERRRSSTQQATRTRQAGGEPQAGHRTATRRTTALRVRSVSEVKQRLFAYPSRPASYAAGGKVQLRSTQLEISDFRNYFSDVLHLAKDQYTLAPLKAGAIVLAGTILGRVGPAAGGKASHMEFMIQPAGRGAPQIDPKPILDGWKLLEATAVYRASGVDPFFGPGAKNPIRRPDPADEQGAAPGRGSSRTRTCTMSICERRAVQAGQSDRRVLAAVEFLSASGARTRRSAASPAPPPATRSPTPR